MLKVLDLFSGIGGFSLGLEKTGGFETVAFCEIAEYPRKVLKKHWPRIKCYPDIKKLTYEQLKKDGHEKIDVIVGGYPCQPFSIAGRKKGEKDTRYLWTEFIRLIRECRPTWVIGENVAGHIKLGLDKVLSDLESEGYSARTFSISGVSVGANHKRERVWIVANANDDGVSSAEESGATGLRSRSSPKESEPSGQSKGSGDGGFRAKDVAHAESIECNVRKPRKHKKEGGIQGEVRRESCDVAHALCFKQGESSQRKRGEDTKRGSIDFTRHKKEGAEGSYKGWWDVEPDVGRVANGIPNRMDRLKCLGNSLIPHIPYYIGLSILKC